MMTSYAFEGVGGRPSNAWGSKYSELCRLVERFGDLEPAGGYLPAEARELLTKIQAKIAEFNASKHRGVGSDATKKGKKDQETDAVQQLETSLADELRFVRISELIDRCANDRTSLLLSNSGKGWQKLFKSRKMSISFSTDATVNAFWSAQTLAINTANFWKADPFPASILVHEYHHVLTHRNPTLYYDEFVAHWKQYDVQYGINGSPNGGGRAQRVAYLNNWILDAPSGYRQRPHVPAGTELTGPEGTADVWTAHLNNFK